MAEGGAETCRSKKSDGHYMLVDCGEQLLKDVEEMKDELQKQMASLGSQQQLLWYVVKNLTVLLLPVTALLGLAVISAILLPSPLANSVSILLVTTTVGFGALNLPPLNEAVKVYLEFKPYTAQFARCQCDKPSQPAVVVSAGDNVEALPKPVLEEAVKNQEALVEKAADMGPKEKHEIKFPVPYKRRTQLNTSGNANGSHDRKTVTHVQSLSSNVNQGVNTSSITGRGADSLHTNDRLTKVE